MSEVSNAPTTWDLIEWSVRVGASRQFDGRVLAALIRHADSRNLQCFVGQQRLAAMVYDLEPETVSRSQINKVSEAIRRLSDAGLISIKQNGHRTRDGFATNLYTLTPDSPVEGESVEGDSPVGGESGLTHSDAPTHPFERTDSPAKGEQTTRETPRENSQHAGMSASRDSRQEVGSSVSSLTAHRNARQERNARRTDSIPSAEELFDLARKRRLFVETASGDFIYKGGSRQWTKSRADILQDLNDPAKAESLWDRMKPEAAVY